MALVPDRALRRLIADLGRRSEAEIQSVLELLDPPQQRVVTELLGEYHGLAPAPQPAEIMTSASPARPLWLAERLDGLGNHRLTPAARDALRDAAAQWQPILPKHERGPSLFSRLRSVLPFAGSV